MIFYYFFILINRKHIYQTDLFSGQLVTTNAEKLYETLENKGIHYIFKLNSFSSPFHSKLLFKMCGSN